MDEITKPFHRTSALHSVINWRPDYLYPYTSNPSSVSLSVHFLRAAHMSSFVHLKGRSIRKAEISKKESMFDGDDEYEKKEITKGMVPHQVWL